MKRRSKGSISAEAQGEPALASRALGRLRFAVVLGIAAVLALIYPLSEGFRSEVGKAVGILVQGDIGALGGYIVSFGAWAPVASLAVMVLQALAAPVPLFLVVLANGLAFGVLWGWLLSMAGVTLAAVVCFGIARGLGRGPVEALVGKTGLEYADRWFARRGVWAVLLARLVPGMAFDAVSFAAGLTRMGFGRFVAATVIGTAPQTLLYTYLGQSAPRYAWAIFAATVLAIGVVAVAAFRKRRKEEKARGQLLLTDGEPPERGLPGPFTQISQTESERALAKCTPYLACFSQLFSRHRA